MINPESKNRPPQEEIKIEKPETEEGVKPSIQDIQKAFREKFEPISKKLEKREGLEERKEVVESSQEAAPAIEEVSLDEKRGWWSKKENLQTAVKAGVLTGGAGLMIGGAAVLGFEGLATVGLIGGGLLIAPFAAYYSLKAFGGFLNSVWFELTGKELFKKKEKK